MFRVKEETSSISSLKEEFAQRIADAEKKLQVACKERDAAKKVISFLMKQILGGVKIWWDTALSNPIWLWS